MNLLTDNSLADLLVTGRRAHLIGIGGIGMSGLAQALLARGWLVSGSDLSDSEVVEQLRRLGAQVFIGHQAAHVAAPDLVAKSDAIKDDNPELLAALQKSLPVFRRSQLLGALTAPLRTIAVAGTHGKTSTSAMLACALDAAGLSPTFFLGGEYPPLGGNARIGQGDWAVVEACEAFASFLDLSPTVAVITNLEPEHLDFHGTKEALYAAFVDFLRRLKSAGTAVICADDPSLPPLVSQAAVENCLTYAVGQEADFRAVDIVASPNGSSFTLTSPDTAPLSVDLQVFGRHNISNALAAIAAASVAGVSPSVAAQGLAAFSGVKRRMELVIRIGGLTVIDDYAHHPTEIAASIAALRAHLPGRLLVVFQPHLYSRTKTFAQEFAQVLSLPDRAWVTDIYPARETPIPGVSAENIAALAKKRFNADVEYLPFDNVATALSQQLCEGDIVVTMGAGNVDRIARSLAKRLSGHTST